MSRRRISVKDLGQVDCQGWLYRKKEGKAFLGNKWKKYWFLLKKTSLYWYTGQLAEKAEGYINLADFTIDQAVECKRKHAMKACRPQIATFYFAAESSSEMNRWLNKLKLLPTQTEPVERSSGECYSEASDNEEAELTDANSSSNPEQASTSVSLPPTSSSPSPNKTSDPGPSPASVTTSQSSLTNHSQSWLEISINSSPGSVAAVGCSSHDVSALPLQADSETCSEEGSQNPSSSQASPLIVLGRNHHQDEVALSSSEHQDATSDEMEQLYIHLKQASLSPIGEHKPSTKKDFRSSFIKRCKNHSINEKLHLVRTLNSTLKAKEADLLTIDQLLADPSLSAVRYRQWKEANMLLLQEICHGQGPWSRDQPTPAAHTILYTETSV
ncbi:interactor protein for cytohesin exchange factors 1 isoform X2 [Conger conger]|nr:interactor protein for cytohesin exchange factors 1 isoform X2 [Conger conger]XP_061097947.1 interactor protein for cytohesin exchange factors 1 isoform X2 [Conger conger]